MMLQAENSHRLFGNSLLAVQAFDEALAPRMRITGETGTLAKLGDFFKDKTLEKGTNLIMLWRVEGILEIFVASPGASAPNDFARVSSHVLVRQRTFSEVHPGSWPCLDCKDKSASWA